MRGINFLTLGAALVLQGAVAGQLTLPNSGSGGPPSVTTVGSLLNHDTADFVVGPGSISRGPGPAASCYVPTGWGIDPTADGSLEGSHAGFTIQWWYQPAQPTSFHYLGGDPAWDAGLGQSFRILVGPQAGPGALLVLGPMAQLATSPYALHSPAVENSGWVHLALVYEHAQSHLTWYVNGVQDTQVITTFQGSGTDLSFCGYAGSTNSAGPEGRFDDLRLYDFARPSSDIAADLTARAAGFGPSGESNVPTAGYYEFHYVPLVPQYQVNSSALSVTMDGVLATSQLPATVTASLVNCSSASGQALTLAISSDQVTESFEIAISSGYLLPASGGGVVLAAGTILNLDISMPLTWMNGGLTPSYLPMTGMTFPGASSVNVVATLYPTTSLNATIQGVVTQPAAATGIDLSQATRLDVAVSGAQQAILPGPLLDDESIVINVTSSPTCWTTAGITFYGTTYTQLHVSANGRVLFGGPEDSADPTVQAAMTGLPFAGFWTDLDPSLAGSVFMSSPVYDTVRIEWQGVAYAGLALAAGTFALEFDASTGAVTLDGLQGIVSNPGFTNVADNQFLGVTPGAVGGATDPGPVLFAAGVSGTTGAATHMIYDFYSYTVFGGLAASLAPGTLSGIAFTPSTGNPPGYDWAGN